MVQGEQTHVTTATAFQRVNNAAWMASALLFLGAWLLASPWTLGYETVAMMRSDILSGALLLVFASVSLLKQKTWSLWASCFVGVWLLFAPLFFWTPSPAAYANGTLVGILVLAFSVLLPYGAPQAGSGTPLGWSYNPSEWSQRIPIVVLGLVTFFIARYMASYQLGHIKDVWEPFFRDGTRSILESEVSKAFPIPDAGLGAAAYLLEALSGCIGDTKRWRTMPWMVLLFWVLVVPPGVTSVVLVILQPLAVGAWCTLCLITALATLITVPPALDEVIAMGDYLRQCRKAGRPLWRTFWLGGEPINDDDLPSSARSSRRIMPISPYLLLSGFLGIWLIAAPPLLGLVGNLSHSGRLIGALVTTTAVVAMAEVGRPLRYINVLFGVWIIVSPWVLSSANGLTNILHHLMTGLLVILLSVPRWRIDERHGEWDRFLRR